MPAISFTVYCKPEPQGSIRAFTPKGWTRPVLTSDNKGLKSFRQEVAKAAIEERSRNGDCGLIFGKHEPVELRVAFFLRKPPSVSRKRSRPVVKPDLSKLVRSTEDALTGIIYPDDAQIVSIVSAKDYADIERVEVIVSTIH